MKGLVKARRAVTNIGMPMPALMLALGLAAVTVDVDSVVAEGAVANSVVANSINADDVRSGSAAADDLILDESSMDGAAETNALAAPPVERGWFRLDSAPLTDSIATDRPDFTESSRSVPRGHVQIEAGYTFTYDREGDDRARTQTVPEALLRVGVADGFELRFAWEGYSWTDTRTREKNEFDRTVTVDDWSQGASDMEVGMKLELTKQDGWCPESALLVMLSLPSGSAGSSSGDVDPLVGVIWAYELTDRLGIGGQVLLAAPTEDGSRFAQSSASLALGVDLTERIGAYVEYYGLYPNGPHADCAHVVDGGFTLLVTDNLQLDWRAGFGLNEEADDFFTGVGIAWRL